MTLDEQTDGGGALTRRERRRRMIVDGAATGSSGASAEPEAASEQAAGDAADVGSDAVPDPETAVLTDADAAVLTDPETAVLTDDDAATDATSDAATAAAPAGDVRVLSEAGSDVTADAETAIASDAAPRTGIEVPIDVTQDSDAATSEAPATAIVSDPETGETPATVIVSDAEVGGAAETGTDARDDDTAEVAALLAADTAMERPAAWADENSPATALLWVDPLAVAAASGAAAIDTSTDRDDGPDLLVGAPRRGILRPGILVPLGTLVALAVAYSATALLWPLHELPPTVEAVAVEPVAAEAAAVTWPADGSAAISVDGIGTASSTGDRAPIASVTKVVSVMLVLEERPLKPGEQGPEYAFDYGDTLDYWSYRRDDQSALDVPVDGTLTEYQMLQGVLLGSANNYIDRLSDEIWGSDSAFADAAEQWLAARGLSDITIVTPSGRNEGNVASPASLTKLASIAMANPVFAEIVGTASVELPGAGLVTNSNGLLGEPGFVGVKTGSLDGDYNLLSGKDVTVGDTTVRLYASVLGQDGDDERLEASRALYAQVEAALQAQGPAVAAETVVGEVSTPWGASADVVTDADAAVVLWNSAAPTAEVVFDLGDATEADDAVGTLTVTGPLDSVEVPVVLAEEIEPPSAWWRLTHPFELFGITD
ncbi:D-alanyl-D-alanine carboxypeptidase family protein [Microbacterium sp. CIAB417]|uniref:D-alanyl-D-alanine carboxypeptidase family protein n=1 Tax=Microbacterium sp. CIAB417 TaxID=2860287 RepID=UPI001FAD7B80|nr:D-alanyl-D-alanine carboxypeptidase [Microbacterium sp. CIAB417]